MSMFTRKMRIITAVVLDEDKEKVVRNLLEKGVMDFVSIGDLDKESMKKLSRHSSDISSQTLADFRVRIETLYRQADLAVPSLVGVDLEKTPKLDIDRIRRFLDRLTIALQGIKDNQKTVNQRLLKNTEMLKYVTENKREYLDLRVGSVGLRREDFVNRIVSTGAVVLADTDPIVTLSLKRDSSRTNEILDKFSWTETSDVSEQKKGYERCSEELEKRIASDKAGLEKLRIEVSDKIKEKKDELDSMWKVVRLHELCESVESYFSYTKNTTLFSGWIPEDDYQTVYDCIFDATKGKCIIESKSAETVERQQVPVSMTSPSFLKPFEHIVNNYGTPEYGSINPTPFTAVAYIIMFMLMFADLGQGFVLLLIGLLGKSWYKKHPMAKDGLISRYLCSLLIYLGPASMVGGLLFGSCFGFSWIPALWFNYHSVVNGHGGEGLIQDVYDILGITIKFGIIIIATGLVLNWINLVRKKRYFELIFDKNGLVGGVLYAVGVWFGFGFVAGGYKEFPTAPWLIPAVIIPLVLIFLKEPVHFVIQKRKGHKESVSQLVINTVMESLIEILEIFSGFLANTLSFMRVAGLGIAHVSLMTAFEDMASMTGNVVFYIIIMILGNLLVIVLEGLSAGINSLRLNYYEFFTKYFTGHGFAYSPIGLGGRVKAN